MNHNETFETVESLEAELVSLTESLWEQPELGLHETESAELLSSVLRDGAFDDLDAVELLNTGSEFMREHVSDDARIHYTIPDGGGAPNVVPAEATAWFYVRAPTRDEVDRITDWLDDVAEGAALMTQTTVSRRFHTGCYDYVANHALSDALLENMRLAGPIPYTDEDREFAAELQETLSAETIEARTAQLPEERREAARSSVLYPDAQPSYDVGTVLNGSTDVGDVSWITPTAQFWAASWPVGTPSHTWQAVATNGSFGSKAAVYAAKVLAATTLDLFSDEALVAAAREEFEASVPGDYECALPEGTEPPFHLTL